MSSRIPERADVVIIGGGIVGCSIAYHLTRLGITNVVLLERKTLTSGTTWHAAGLVGQLRATRNLTELAKYSTDLFRTLEAETGMATGFRQNGSISVALNDGRLEEFLRGASMGRSFGLEVEALSAGDIAERLPHLNAEGVVGGVFLPNDGQINPIDATQAFAAGARQRGAKILENIKVERILTDGGRATGVVTAEGEIRSDKVVIASGMWSRDLAKPLDVHLPLHAAEHFYIVTEAIADLPRNMPVTRIPDEYAYYKEDAGKLLLGAFEPNAKPWGMEGIAEDHSFETLPMDMDHFEPVLEFAVSRMPMLETAGISLFFNGPESFTPDDRYLLGETPTVRDLFVAAGFNSIGIQSAGGVGKVLSEWIRDGHPPIDLSDVDIRRMHPFQSNKNYLHDRTTETLGLLYAMHWPFRQVESARGARRSPFHDRLVAAGACMGEMSGWERPNWFNAPGSKPAYEYSYGRQNWFDNTAAEARGLRDQVALFDQSSFAKFLVQGRDSVRVLNRISANNVDVVAGRLVYTQWLNERGGIEADLTITRIAENEFMVVTGGANQIRDLTWLRRHVPADAHCTVTDITAGLPMLGLMGPRSRAMLEKLTGADLSNSAFPFATSRELELGYARIRASRVTYVGELGWEIYIPGEFAAHVFDTITAAGEEFGLVHGGYHLMNSARMEKGYRHWGHDIAEEDTPIEAGLGFAVAYDKPGGFIGDTVLKQQRAANLLTKRMVAVALDDDGPSAPMMYHEEPILKDGRIIGSTTSGMWGHRIGKSLGLGYVRNDEGVTSDYLKTGTFEVEIAWKRYPAKLQLQPFYDPKSERVKA